MRKEFLASTAMAALISALAGGSALASDLPAPAAEPAAPAPSIYDWTGFYAGIHAGYAGGREHDNQSALFPKPPTASNPPSENGPSATSADHFSMDGFVGGLHAGYNYQFQQFVVGVEGDIDYTTLQGSHTFSYPDYGVAGSLKMKTDWQGSARVRAGYAIDNFLLYATGGVAFADGELSTNGIGTNKTHVGWTAGGGLEYAFTPNWIGRIEVRYTDFSKETYQTIYGPVKADWNQTTATVGASYKF